MITKEEWGRLRIGDILVSKGGHDREIIRIFNDSYIEFKALKILKLFPEGKVSGKTAAYLYSDIYKTYTIKHMKEPKLAIEEQSFYYCLKMAGYNQLSDKQIKEIYALAILVKSKKSAVSLKEIAEVQLKVLEQFEKPKS